MSIVAPVRHGLGVGDVGVAVTHQSCHRPRSDACAASSHGLRIVDVERADEVGEVGRDARRADPPVAAARSHCALRRGPATRESEAIRGSESMRAVNSLSRSIVRSSGIADDDEGAPPAGADRGSALGPHSAS